MASSLKQDQSHQRRWPLDSEHAIELVGQLPFIYFCCHRVTIHPKVLYRQNDKIVKLKQHHHIV